MFYVRSSGITAVMAQLLIHKVEEVEISFVVLSLENYKLHQAAARPLSAADSIDQLSDDTSNYIN
jgi:CO dehydrogenase/acetyl-CoA synthase delta subunit